jgi:hypothetical protein
MERGCTGLEMQIGIVIAIREEYATVLKFLDVKTEEPDGVVFARGR